jgi:hypothetical protein
MLQMWLRREGYLLVPGFSFLIRTTFHTCHSTPKLLFYV